MTFPPTVGSNAASVSGRYGEYLTPSEARDVLFGYIKAEGLDHPTVREGCSSTPAGVSAEPREPRDSALKPLGEQGRLIGDIRQV